MDADRTKQLEIDIKQLRADNGLLRDRIKDLDEKLQAVRHKLLLFQAESRSLNSKANDILQFVDETGGQVG
jgi:hypothetical protein